MWRVLTVQNWLSNAEGILTSAYNLRLITCSPGPRFPFEHITPTTRMIHNQCRRGMGTKIHADAAAKHNLATAWAAQMLSRRFLDMRCLDNALQYMRDKPDGYYIFMRPNDTESDTFAVLLRDRDTTVRYNIRPNENYTTYIMSTLEGGERCYNSISELVDQWDDSHYDYNMIRKMEMNEMSLGAQCRGYLNSSAGTRARTQSHISQLYTGDVKLFDNPLPRPSIPSIHHKSALPECRSPSDGPQTRGNVFFKP